MLKFSPDQLSRAMSAAGVDDTALATALGVHRSTVWQWRNGQNGTRPLGDAIANISQILGQPMEYFFAETGANNRQPHPKTSA
jgi:transcriptional regulator with XRE-family HTH domain